MIRRYLPHSLLASFLLFQSSCSDSSDSDAQSTSEPGPATAQYSVGESPHWVSTADLNNDGVLDLVVVNQGSNDISVLLGLGRGYFDSATTYSFAGLDTPQSCAVSDLDNDGAADAAIANDNGGNVKLVAGDGAGAFSFLRDMTAHSRPTAVVAADFNEDGVMDLAVSNQLSDDVSVLIGKGDGLFYDAVNYPVHGHTQWLVVGDFDGDGIWDLAASNYNSNDISVLIGQGSGGVGNGTFSAAANYSAGTWPSRMAAGDLNNDGYCDLVVSNWTADTVSVLISNGTKTATFQSPVAYAVGSGPQGVAIADVNNDGFPDIIVANSESNTFSVLLSETGDGTFANAVNYEAGSYPMGIAASDFDSDGLTDLVFTNYTTAKIAVFLNQGGYFVYSP